jgi:CRP-like cAMP-binding protein
LVSYSSFSTIDFILKMPNPFEQICDHISELVPLDEHDKKCISERFESKTLEKKEVLLAEGAVSHHMMYIFQGCLITCAPNENGVERVLQIGIENWWVNDLNSFFTQKGSAYTIKAIEASTVHQIHRDELEVLFKEVPKMERFFRLKIQNAYTAQQARFLSNVTHTAEERYAKFRNRYKALEQRVPQYMVASYLGITPEFLSTIRKNDEKK